MDPNVTTIPVPAVSPFGPASVIVDAPIRTGPGPTFDLIFTVPMGSAVQQSGHVVDGYITMQYEAVTGWVALENLGAPSAVAEVAPLGGSTAPVEPPSVEAPPVESPPSETLPIETAATETPLTESPPPEIPTAEVPPAETATAGSAPVEVPSVDAALVEMAPVDTPKEPRRS